MEIDNNMTPEEILCEARLALADEGVAIDGSHWNPATAVLIAEAVNWAAKCIDEAFYFIKPGVIEAALAVGAEGGWGEDGVFYLAAPDVGVACFHDPMGQLAHIKAIWPEGWSGIRRQPWAFEICERASVRRLFAAATDPDGVLYGLTNSQVERFARRLCAV